MDNNINTNINIDNPRINPISFVRRTLVGLAILIVFGAVLLISYFYDRVVMSVFLCILVIVAVIEMRRALGKRIPDQFSWLVWTFAIAFGPIYFFSGFTGIAFLMLITFIAGCCIAIVNNIRFQAIRNFAFLLVYPALIMSALLFINRSVPVKDWSGFTMWGEGVIASSGLTNFNTIGLFLVFIVSWATDTCAYLGGTMLGKRKLCPQLSPSKTVEGAIFGLIGGLLGAGLVFLIFEVPMFSAVPLLHPGLPVELGLKIIIYIVIGLVGSFCTQVGDLTASLVKRHCEIKDYSRILGSHGGIMDRFDGIMFNACLVAFIFSFIL